MNHCEIYEEKTERSVKVMLVFETMVSNLWQKVL